MLKKKKNTGDQMGWAIAHLQFYVATLQWCDDWRGEAGTTGTPARTTEDLSMRACTGLAKGGLSRQTSLDSLSQQTSLDSLSRRRILYRDRVGSPCVAIGVFSVATRFWVVGVFVSRHNFGVMTVVLHCGFSYVL